MSAFVLVYDSVPDHPALRTPGERICGEAAWVRLLVKARRNPGEGMHVGQLRTSYATLAEEWSWSRDQVRRYLARLERADMLRVQGTSAGLLVTIERFVEYQRRRGVAPATPPAIPAATPPAMAPATIRARFHDQGIEQVDQDLPPSPPGGTEEGANKAVAKAPPIRMLALDYGGTSVEIVFAYQPDPGIRGLLRAHGFSYGDLCDGAKGWCGPRSPQTAAMLAMLGRKMPGEPAQLATQHEPVPEPEPFCAAGDLDAMRCLIVSTIGDEAARRYLSDGSLAEDGDTLVVRCRDARTAGLAELYIADAIHGAAVSAGYSQVRFESRTEAA